MLLHEAICHFLPVKIRAKKITYWFCRGLLPSPRASSEECNICLELTRMMIKESSLRRDPDLGGELALLAKGCDFVLPSRFKKRLKSFQQAQV